MRRARASADKVQADIDTVQEATEFVASLERGVSVQMAIDAGHAHDHTGGREEHVTVDTQDTIPDALIEKIQTAASRRELHTLHAIVTDVWADFGPQAVQAIANSDRFQGGMRGLYGVSFVLAEQARYGQSLQHKRVIPAA